MQRKEIMKTRREQEAHQEGIDPLEMIETTKGSIGENKALIEGNKHQKEGADGTTAQIEEEREVRETTLMMKGEDIRMKISEGVARDPLVKRDPFQAIL